MFSTKTFFIFLLASSGGFANSDGFRRPREAAPFQDDTLSDAAVMTEIFVAKLTKAIEAHKTEVTAALFATNFTFEGCFSNYNKSQAVKFLDDIPMGHVFALPIRGVKDIGRAISFTLLSIGLLPNANGAHFLLDKQTQQLIYGTSADCIPVDSDDLIGYSSAGNKVPIDSSKIFKFVDRMSKRINSGDVSQIASLLEPTFVFQACDRVYNRDDVVEFLHLLPIEPQFACNVKAFPSPESDWKVTVTANKLFPKAESIGPNRVDAEFILNMDNQKFESGFITSCQNDGSIFY